MQPKEIRKNANGIALCLIGYTFICFAAVGIEALIYLIYAAMVETGTEARTTLFQSLVEQSYSSGVSSIAGVTAGVLLLYVCMRKRLSLQTVFHKNASMTRKDFMMLLCVFLSGQLIFSLLGNLLEFTLNLCGLTAMEQLTAASSQSTTVSMLLYSALFAPVAEELIYRGFVLRSLMPYGKVFAVTASAVLFGVMHGNLFQMAFAFLVGLVLGYTAATYSIRWSILLHVLNNFLFGDVLSYALSGLSPAVQDYCYRGINILFFAAGAFFVLKQREQVVSYFRTGGSQKAYWLHTFTAAVMLLFVVWNLWMALSGIHALEG